MTKLAEQFGSMSDRSARRQMVAQHPSVHGIDYISMPDSHTLNVYFIKPVTTIALHKILPAFNSNYITFTVIKDGVRHEPEIQLHFDSENYKVVITPDITLCDGTDTIMRVVMNVSFVDKFFSQAEYHLADFNQNALNQDELESLEYKPLSRLDYLSKDYDSFRKLIEHELTRNTPTWKENNAADMMIAISEVLAYSGDYLSYEQDSVATEAYLETARFAVSLKRHSRLLDYHINPRVNARTWVKIEVSGKINIPKGTSLFCGGEGVNNTVLLENEFHLRCGGRELVFETMHDILCNQDYQSLKLFSWGVDDFILRAGVTEAALSGWIDLKKGQLIVFSCSEGRQQSQVVRLKCNAIFSTDPLSGDKYTQVRWLEEDELHDVRESQDCVINGNVVLVDRGETIPLEQLELVQDNTIYVSTLDCPNIIYAQEYCHDTAKRQPAVKAIKQNITKAIPVIKLTESVLPISDAEKCSELLKENSEHWYAVSDFMACTPYSRNIVVDDHERGWVIRFGDGVYGACPSSDSHYYATYRITPNTMPKIATGAINQIYIKNASGTELDQIEAVSSLAGTSDASSGDSKEIIRKVAPIRHWSRKNLALPQDYILKIQEFSDVRDVCFSKGWSGSRPIYYFYIYPTNKMSEQRLKEMATKLAVYKVMHHRFALYFYRPLLLQIMIDIKIGSGFYVNEMLLKLRNRFGDDQTNGFLAKRNFGFDQTLYPSEIIKAAFSIEGVFSAELSSFQRLDDYVGNDEKNALVEKIQPCDSEVIAYLGDGRQSIIKFSINGGAYV